MLFRSTVFQFVRPRPLGRRRLTTPVPDVPLLLDGALSFDVATNGISYARVLYDVSHVAPADWPWLDLYADLLPDLGTGELDYAAADAWRQALVPSFRVGLDQSLTQDGKLRLEVVFSSSALREEHGAIAEVLATSIAGARFDETARIAEGTHRKHAGVAAVAGKAAVRAALLA